MSDLLTLIILHLASGDIFSILCIQKECLNWDVEVNKIIYYIINHFFVTQDVLWWDEYALIILYVSK